MPEKELITIATGGTLTAVVAWFSKKVLLIDKNHVSRAELEKHLDKQAEVLMKVVDKQGDLIRKELHHQSSRIDSILTHHLMKGE